MTRHLLTVAVLLLATAPTGVRGQQPLPTPLEMIAAGGETATRPAPSTLSSAAPPTSTPTKAAGVTRTVGLWLTYELARQRDVMAWEAKRLLGQIPASAGLLLLPAVGVLTLGRRRETGETVAAPDSEPALSRAERARMLLESGVATTDAARETRMSREGLDLLLHLSGTVRPAPAMRRDPWGRSTPSRPRSSAPVQGYAAYRSGT